MVCFTLCFWIHLLENVSTVLKFFLWGIFAFRVKCVIQLFKKIQFYRFPYFLVKINNVLCTSGTPHSNLLPTMSKWNHFWEPFTPTFP